MMSPILGGGHPGADLQLGPFRESVLPTDAPRGARGHPGTSVGRAQGHLGAEAVALLPLVTLAVGLRTFAEESAWDMWVTLSEGESVWSQF